MSTSKIQWLLAMAAALRKSRGLGWLLGLGPALPYHTGLPCSPCTPGRSSAWLERLVRDQEVAGSNPVAPILAKGQNTVPIHRGSLLLTCSDSTCSIRQWAIHQG